MWFFKKKKSELEKTREENIAKANDLITRVYNDEDIERYEKYNVINTKKEIENLNKVLIKMVECIDEYTYDQYKKIKDEIKEKEEKMEFSILKVEYMKNHIGKHLNNWVPANELVER